MKVPASVFVVTLNEEKNITRLLKSLQSFAEVILVDSGSKDTTLAQARNFNNVTILHHDWAGYAAQKQWAMEQCTHEWTLNLDADEEMTQELQQAIAHTIRDQNADGLVCTIEDIFLGHRPHRLCGRNTKLRFFRKDKARYIQHKVHESVEVKGTLHYTKSSFLHYDTQSIENKVNRLAHYARLKAEEKYAKGRRASHAKLLFIGPWKFFQTYIIGRNFLNGTRGFIGAKIVAHYAFLKEAELWSLTHEKNKD